MFFAQPENFSHANQPFVPDCHGNSSNYTEPTPGNSPGADVEHPRLKIFCRAPRFFYNLGD